MFSCEGIGKTIEKAIENALLELKAIREDVDIKILNEGGLFKKAKVLVTISEEARPKYEKRKLFVEEEKKEELNDNLKNKSQEEKDLTTDKEITKIDIKSQNKENDEIKDISKTEDNAKDNFDEKQEKIVPPHQFLKGLFDVAGKEVEININEDEKYIHISVIGNDLGNMIGHRGDCFYAISKLVSILAGKQSKKILLDIGGYREKRAESLINLAKRTAEKVAKSGRYIKLLPMNPADRRIIHTALQDDNRVTTLSKGTEPNRYVIVFPKNED